MRRIGRWMLNALTVLSLLLCVGLAITYLLSGRASGLFIAGLPRGSVVFSTRTELDVAGVRMPAGLTMVLTAVLPVPWLAMWIKRVAKRERRHGVCPQCLYDLTGNVSGVCPECGREIATKTGAGITEAA